MLMQSLLRISGFSALLFYAVPTAYSQPETLNPVYLRQKALDNSSDLYTYLADERSKAQALERRLRAAKPVEVRDIIETGKLEGVGVASVIAKSLQAMPRPASAIQAAAEQKQIIEAIQMQAAAIADFQPQLQTLTSDLRTLPPENIVARVAALPVSQEVGNIIAPQAIPGAAALPSNSQQPTFSFGRIVPFIVGDGSVTTVDYPSVGALITDAADVGYFAACTGTLITPYVVLTAQHCVKGLSPKYVYFQHSGFYKIRDWAVQDGYTYPYPHSDIALLFLNRPVTGIRPAEINDIERSKQGNVSRIVGYGKRRPPPDEKLNDTIKEWFSFTGLKLHAESVKDSCAQFATPGSPYNLSDVICSYYKKSGFHQKASTCGGDSGGPLFSRIGTAVRVIGVASGGFKCAPGDPFFHVEVFDHVKWIRDQIKVFEDNYKPEISADSNGTVLNPIENASSAYLIADHFNRFEMTGWEKSFLIRQSIEWIRIGINADQSEQNVRIVIQPPNKAPPCTVESYGTFSICSFAKPPVGPWDMKATGQLNQEFQIVVTEFR